MTPAALFEFEKPIEELEQKIQELRDAEEKDESVWLEIKRLEEKLTEKKFEIYSTLTPWQRVQLARHADRPHSIHYIKSLFNNWTELAGDRHFGNDKAIMAGFAHFMGRPVAVIGQEKGADTKERLARNFGMPHPEGYRKAMRLMHLAEKFHLPIIAFIDTSGAFPGIGSEERGVAEAIARNLLEMSLLKTPVVCCVISEGGSGGALGIGVGDVILMLENAWYSVISPEGCAGILYHDRAMAPEAAKMLKITAADLKALGVIDEIVPEPLGGAHRNPEEASHNVKRALAKHLDRLRRKRIPDLLEERFQKFRAMGVFEENQQ